jgi:hypothetical protein
MKKFYPHGHPVKFKHQNTGDIRSSIPYNEGYVTFYGRIVGFYGKTTKHYKDATYMVATPYGDSFNINHTRIETVTGSKESEILIGFEKDASTLKGSKIYGGVIENLYLLKYRRLPHDQFVLHHTHQADFKLLMPVRKDEVYSKAKVTGYRASFDNPKIQIAYNSFSGSGLPLKQDHDLTDIENLVPILYKFRDLIEVMDFSYNANLYEKFKKAVPLIELLKCAIGDIAVLIDDHDDPKNYGITIADGQDNRSPYLMVNSYVDGFTLKIREKDWVMVLSTLNDDRPLICDYYKLIDLLYQMHFAVRLDKDQFVPNEERKSSIVDLGILPAFVI